MQLLQNGFKIGNVINVHQLGKSGYNRVYGLLILPAGKCYNKKADFSLYSFDKEKKGYLVSTYNIYDKGACLTAKDTVIIKDFSPPRLPIDSVSAKLLDSALTRIFRKASER